MSSYATKGYVSFYYKRAINTHDFTPGRRMPRMRVPSAREHDIYGEGTHGSGEGEENRAHKGVCPHSVVVQGRH